MAQPHLFLQDEAYQYLEQQIKSGVFEPGKTYSLNAITNLLQMSRTPVRDALQKLAQEGLVENLPSRGFRVKAMSQKQILELYQIRCAIEGYCCFQLALQCREPEDAPFYAQLRLNLELQEQIVKQGLGATKFLEVDRAFHNLLLHRLGNEELERIIENYRDRINHFALASLRRPGLLKQTLLEHGAVAEAVIRREPETARTAMVNHMNTAISPWPPAFRQSSEENDSEKLERNEAL